MRLHGVYFNGKDDLNIHILANSANYYTYKIRVSYITNPTFNSQ